MLLFGISLLLLASVSLGSLYSVTIGSQAEKELLISENNLIKIKKIGEIKALFGLQIQEWKNTIIRGAHAEENIKHASSMLNASKDIVTTAESIRPLLSEDEKLLLINFIKTQNELIEKYVSAKDKFLDITKTIAFLKSSFSENIFLNLSKNPEIWL